MHTSNLQASRKTKKTPVGDIPVDWGCCRLSEVVQQLESGVSVGGEDRSPAPDEVGVLKVSAVTSGKFLPSEAKAVICKKMEQLQTRVETDSILVNRANGSPDLVGSAVYVASTHSNLFLSDKLWQIRPLSDRVLGRYLGFVLSAPAFQRRVLERSSGGTGMLNISSGSYLSIPVAVPPLDEQQKIVQILSVLDEALARLVEFAAATGERKRGLMQQLLTGRTRFKEFKGERWRTFRLGDLLEEVDRYVTFDDERTYKLASIRRRSEGFFLRGALQGKDIKTKVMKTIRAGDFLLSKMQVVHGAWGLVTPEFDGMFVSDSYIALVPRDGSALKIEFLNYLSRMPLMRHLAYICSHGVHIEKMTFKLDDFLHEKITIPTTIEEQRNIVGVLSTCDRNIELLQKQLNALKEQKRGLMQKLLTGEVRVKV